MHRAILLLGGNAPNTLDVFFKVEQLICQGVGSIVERSSDYGSQPWGFEADHDFFNRVIEVETPLLATELLTSVLDFEIQLGRVRTNSLGYSSRVIDVDILFYDDVVVETRQLTIPHPKLHLRRFTLLPLVEKWGHLQHPTLHKTMKELLKNCPDMGKVWLID